MDRPLSAKSWSLYLLAESQKVSIKGKIVFNGEKMPYEMIHQEKPNLHDTHTGKRTLCLNKARR